MPQTELEILLAIIILFKDIMHYEIGWNSRICGDIQVESQILDGWYTFIITVHGILCTLYMETDFR